MSTKDLKSSLAKETASIKEVMRIIDHSGLRVAYIVDDQGRFKGAVSDSEIRKSIIHGKDVKSSVKNIINENPVILREKDLSNNYLVRATIKKLISKMPDSRHILLVSENGFPLKLVPFVEFQEHKVAEKSKEGHGKKVLVVGGAGYLGSILVRKLIKGGFSVRALDALLFGVEPVKDLLKHKRFELIKGDMRNIQTLVNALNDVEAVINLAAIVGDPACKNRPDQAIETNFLANKALAEACKYHQINRFIYASTCSVYGAMEGNIAATEEAPLAPVSLYARSKIQAEEGILALEDDNFAPTVLRMSTLYGHSHRMRFDLVVNTMTKTALLEKKINVHSGGLQWRPLLNVDDAAEAFVKCLQAPLKKIKGQVFNVGSSHQNYQIIDIAKAVHQLIPKAEIVYSGEAVDARNYCVSFAKIEKVLNFKCAYDIKDSIRRISKSIQKGEIKNANDSKYYNVEFK